VRKCKLFIKEMLTHLVSSNWLPPRRCIIDRGGEGYRGNEGPWAPKTDRGEGYRGNQSGRGPPPPPLFQKNNTPLYMEFGL